jgi:hypothetical protein
MRFAVIAFEMVLHPFYQLGFAVAKADHSSEVGGGRVSTVVVS